MPKKKAKAGAPKAKAPAAEADDDWLGAAEGGDDDLGIGGDGASDGEEPEDEDDPGIGADDDQDPDAAGDDDTEGQASGEQSRLLARIASGEADLGAVKQRISDAVTLLGKWREARKLGDGRTRAEVFAGLVADCSTYFGYSEELAEYFLQMFSPDQAIKFFEANEQQRPLTIRTNTLKARRSSLIQALQARKVNLDPIGPWTKVGLKVYESAVPVGATPEYLAGQYMIQSASSLVPVMALAPQQNEVVLDMAAAPGGKTTYIGQLMRNTGTLFANDLRRDRCKSLVANIHRLGLTNTVVLSLDGKKLKGMLPRLDRVLLDSPCTGSGIIARDPSVKVKRGTKDFEEASKLSKELLTTAIDMVDAGSKTGGYIVYSTCSLAVEENEAVVDHVLKHRNVELVSFSSAVNFGVEGMTKYRERRFHPTLALTRRYMPHVHNMDGFYVAKLKKTSNDIPERAKKDRSRDAGTVWGEDKWTPEMMETVVDFEPGEEGKSVASKPKPLNKIERKKLRRQQKLAERASSEAAATAAASAAAATVKAVKDPEQTPEEQPDGAPEASSGQRKRLKKRRRPTEDADEAEAAAKPKKRIKAVAKPKKKK